MRALGWGFLGPFDLISNSPWNCSTDTWCAAGILLKLGLGAWLDQRPACPSIKMKKSKLSHWTWEIEWEECHFSFKTEQKLSHPDEHLFYNPVAQSTKIVNWHWTMFENCHYGDIFKKRLSLNGQFHTKKTSFEGTISKLIFLEQNILMLFLNVCHFLGVILGPFKGYFVSFWPKT